MDKSIIQHEDIPTNISKSDFNLEAYEEKIRDKKQEVLEAVFFAEELGKSVLVFCSSVDQAEELQSLVPGSEVVSAKTKKKERGRIINGFRSQEIHTVFNVGVLTTGFDHPSLDCIVLLRPTMSIGLYYQMLGRGVRRAEGKEYCRVIDMTGTVKKIGRIETIRLKRDETGWNLQSETCANWHNRSLYTFKLHQGREN